MERKVVSKFAALLGEHKTRISTVSRETGISRTTLTNLYYGTSGAVSFDVLEKLCGYFQCGVGDILTIENERRAS